MESKHGNTSLFSCILVLSLQELSVKANYLHHSLLSELGLSVWPDWVEDHAVLPTAQRGHLYNPDYLLSHRGDVCFSVCHRHQPFLPGPSVSASSIPEWTQSTNM